MHFQDNGIKLTFYSSYHMKKDVIKYIATPKRIWTMIDLF